MQVSDVAVGWLSHEAGFYAQPYLLAILFKAVRLWLGPGMVTPYMNPWQSRDRFPRVRLRSRRIIRSRQGLCPSFPALDWGNNLPRDLEGPYRGRLQAGLVIRYYRRLAPRLILRDASGPLIRPSSVHRRPRYAFTMWSRPRVLRVSGQIFCVLKGLGAGEKTPRPPHPRRWHRHVPARGTWRWLLLAGSDAVPPRLPTSGREM
jgi:hypothetical protein